MAEVDQSRNVVINYFIFFHHYSCRDHNEVDVNAVYHQLQDTYQSDSDDTQQPGTSTGGVTPAGRRRFVLSLFYVIDLFFFSFHFDLIFVTPTDLDEM